MKSKKIVWSIFFLLIFLMFPVQVQALANPAAIFCEEQGYELDLETGDCIFPDGNRCNQWKFYRGECGENYQEDIPCKKAGETLILNSDFGTGDCCSGLKKISNPIRDLSLQDKCPDPASERNIVGAPAGICSDCGNGICEDWEDRCNCPVDCDTERTDQQKKTIDLEISPAVTQTDSLQPLNSQDGNDEKIDNEDMLVKQDPSIWIWTIAGFVPLAVLLIIVSKYFNNK